MWEYFKKLRRFDAYPKTLEDVKIQTLGGGTSRWSCTCINWKICNTDFLVSLISFLVMGLLFWTQFMDYLTPNVSEELFVDTSRSPNIQINLDIIIPKVSCDCKLII